MHGGERKCTAGLIDSPECPHCGASNQDDMHLIWECPTYRESESPAISKSQGLLRGARIGGEECPAFWLRGIVPIWWTHRKTRADSDAFQFGDIDTAIAELAKFFLDGSGGRHYKDPRLRAVGWAVGDVGTCNRAAGVGTCRGVGSRSAGFPGTCTAAEILPTADDVETEIGFGGFSNPWRVWRSRAPLGHLQGSH